MGSRTVAHDIARLLTNRDTFAQLLHAVKGDTTKWLHSRVCGTLRAVVTHRDCWAVSET